MTKLEILSPRAHIGNNAKMECIVSNMSKKNIKIISWTMRENEDEPIHIYPSLEGDSSKFHMLPTGELLVLNVTYSDSRKLFRCRALNLLSQETTISSSVGRIDITGVY